MLSDLEKLAEKEPESYIKIWDNFGAVLKEGIYEDFERRDALLGTVPFQDDHIGRVVAKSQGLSRFAQIKPDRNLLSRGG